MKKISVLFLLTALSLSVLGCSSIKKMTGQTDDTILPGQREDILPPDAQTAKDPAVNGKKGQSACKADDLNCISPIDQESSTPQ
jgi:hypothetical protein